MTRPLTPRQRQIVALMSEGKNKTEIASTLGISTDTVKAHTDDAYRRLDIKGLGNPGHRFVALYASGQIKAASTTD